MKNKLTNFGVYIVKKLFFPVYVKIYSEGFAESQRLSDPDYIDYDFLEEDYEDFLREEDEPCVDENDPYSDAYTGDYDESLPSDLQEMSVNLNTAQYVGEDTHAAFTEWYKKESNSDEKYEDFLNGYMNYVIVGNIWIKSDNGQVSIAEPCRGTSGTWEIYSRGELFEDCERYDWKVDALTRIYWLLHIHKPYAVS